jgi:hypothetical protein
MRTQAYLLVLAFGLGCSDGDDLLSEKSNRPEDRVDPSVAPGSEALGFSETPLRRLTRAELKATINSIFPGVGLSDELFRALPDDSDTPFDNDATGQAANRKLIESTFLLAESTQARVLENPMMRSALYQATPKGVRDDALLMVLTKKLGRRVLRRPLTEEEVAGYVARFAPFGEMENRFEAAVGRVIASLLQDVEFLYRLESPVSPPDSANRVAISDFAIATRMSYLLWGTCPDDALLDRAEAGSLHSSAGRRAVATEMLKDAQAQAQVARFHAMWIGYESSLPQTSALSPEMRGKLRSETDTLIRSVVFEKRSAWLDLLRADGTFIDDALATHYGDMPAPGSAEPKWTLYGDSKRRGILGHGAVLNVANKFADTSPTQRGIMVRERLLCSPVLQTPPDLKVNTDQPPSGNKCKLQNYHQVLAQGACGGCHKQMDPIGFGLERFDLSGKFRVNEPAGPDCPIDGKGTFSSQGKDTAFEGPGELANALIASGEVEACLQKRVFAFSMGRPEAASDAETLKAMQTFMNANQGRFDSLLVEIVSAGSFSSKTITQ